MRFFLMLVCGFMCVWLLGGCTVVSPWERGQLARTEMAFDPDPLESTMQEHIYFSKEASASGSAVSGGGCGCN